MEQTTTALDLESKELEELQDELYIQEDLDLQLDEEVEEIINSTEPAKNNDSELESITSEDIKEAKESKKKRTKKPKKVLVEDLQGFEASNRFNPKNGVITADTFFSIDNMTTQNIEEYVGLFGVKAETITKLRKDLNVKKSALINYFFKVLKIKYISKGATKRLVTVSAHVASDNVHKSFEEMVKDLSDLNSDFRNLSNKNYRSKYFD